MAWVDRVLLGEHASGGCFVPVVALWAAAFGVAQCWVEHRVRQSQRQREGGEVRKLHLELFDQTNVMNE